MVLIFQSYTLFLLLKNKTKYETDYHIFKLAQLQILINNLHLHWYSIIFGKSHTAFFPFFINHRFFVDNA